MRLRRGQLTRIAQAGKGVTAWYSLRRVVSLVIPLCLALMVPLFNSGLTHADPPGTVRFVKDFTQGELAGNSFGQIAIADLGSPLHINGRPYLLFGDNFAPRPWGSNDILSGVRHPSAAVGYSDDPASIRLTGPTLGLGPTLFDVGDYEGKPLPPYWGPISNLPAGSIEVPGDQRTLVLANTVVNLTPIDSRFVFATEQTPWVTAPHSQIYRPGLDPGVHYSGQQWVDMSDQPDTQITRSVYTRGAVYLFSAGFKRRLPARLVRIPLKPGSNWVDSIVDRSNWQQVGQLSSDRIGEMDLAQLAPNKFIFTYLNASRGAIMMRVAPTVWGLLSAPDQVIAKDALWPTPADTTAFPTLEGNLALAQCYGGYVASYDPRTDKVFVVLSQWHTDGATNSPYRSLVFSVQL